MKKLRMAIVVSHPIQHFSPQYASLAKHPLIELKVFFASALGWKKYRDAQFGQELSWNNLQLEDYDHEFLNSGKVLPADKNLDAPELDAALSAYRPDLLVLYGYFQKLQRRTHRWAIRNQVRMAYISDSERKQKRAAWKELVKLAFLRNFFSSIPIFLTVGDANEAYYRYYGVPSGKLVRMHFSIDIKTFEPAFKEKEALAAAFRRQYAIAEHEFLVSVVGKLVSWKRQEDLIDAVHLLEQRGISMTLCIVGSGESEPMLREKAKKLSASKVLFTGFTPPESLPAVYAATSVYVHPAAIEPHSLAISEAIYMGSPVLVSDHCGSYGPNDDVQPEINGAVFPCGNIRKLADQLEQLYRDPAKRERWGAASRAIGYAFQQRSHGGFVEDLLARLQWNPTLQNA